MYGKGSLDVSYTRDLRDKIESLRNNTINNSSSEANFVNSSGRKSKKFMS